MLGINIGDRAELSRIIASGFMIFLLTSAIIIADVQAASQITVQTDRSSYTLGDTVLISFSIANLKAEVNVEVKLEIVEPAGTLNYIYVDVTSDAGGNAGGTFNFPLQQGRDTGIYSASASIPSEGIVSNVVQFKVGPGVVLITVQTDRSSYTPCDTVVTSFSIANLPTTVSVEFKIEYTTPSGPFRSARYVTSDYAGNAGGTDGFVIQQDDPPGSYSVSAFIPSMGVVSNVVPFTVDAIVAFNFTIQLSPTGVTVEPGETGNFKVPITFSDPCYLEQIFFQVTGLGPGMNYELLESDLKITTSSTTPPGTYPITVIGSALGKTHQTSGSIVVTTTALPFDFSVSLSPSTQTVKLKGTTTYNVDVTLVSGPGETVSLTLSGLPGDVTHQFAQASGTPPFSTTLTIDTSTSSSTGSYTLTVTATGGGTSKTATATLTIQAEVDFSISASPVTTEITPGDSSSTTVTIDDVGDYDQSVTLTATGLPSGVTPQFSPASGKPSFNAILKIDTTESTPLGTYTVTIDASGGGTTHSTTITLTIKEKLQPSTTHTATEQVMTESESNITTTLSNPLFLAIIGIIGGAAAAIVVLMRRGRPPPPGAPRKLTVYCINCGEPIRANAKHCPHCGVAQK